MPNWCQNNLILSHKDPKKIKMVIEAIENDRFFDTIKPMPKELRETISGGLGAGTPEQKALEEQQASNRAKYGYPTWYEFANCEWGTKWDAQDAEIINVTEPEWVDHGNGLKLIDASVFVLFDTAWASPIGIYEELVEMGFEVDGRYYEAGCGFAGWFTNEGGDSYFEWESLQNAIDILPEELDEEFNIIENLEEWVDDQAEEERRDEKNGLYPDKLDDAN